MDPQGSPARVGRDGALSLRFERRGAATVLAGCRFTLPLQVLAPLALGDGPGVVVSMLNPTGAVLAGDRLRVDVDVHAGAHAVLTTPSATKIYRSDGAVAEQHVRLGVHGDGVLEWVPDHTIPFARSAYRQSLHARVDAAAALVLVDAFSAGRVVSGESWRFTRLESGLTIVDDDGWLLHDRFVLTDALPWNGLGFTEGAPYFATIVVVTPVSAPVEPLAAAAQGALDRAAGMRGGIGWLPRRGMLVRCLAETAPELEHGLRTVWDAVHTHVTGAAAVDLRKY